MEAKAVGTRAELVPRFEVPLPAAASAAPLTLRELIAMTVRAERDAADERRRTHSLREVLTDRVLQRGQSAGAIRSGERPTAPPPAAEAAIHAAIEGFTDGLYLVAIDGVQCDDLDAPLALTAESRITYLRLVALAGG